MPNVTYEFQVTKKDTCEHVIEFLGATFIKNTATTTIYGRCGNCDKRWKGIVTDEEMMMMSNGRLKVTEVEEL